MYTKIRKKDFTSTKGIKLLKDPTIFILKDFTSFKNITSKISNQTKSLSLQSYKTTSSKIIRIIN